MTPEEFFRDYVSRAYQNHKNNLSDDYYLRVVCIFLDQMSDYVCNGEQTKTGDYKKLLGKDLIHYPTVQAVANGTKHKKSKIYPTKATVSAASVTSEKCISIYSDGQNYHIEPTESFFLTDADNRQYSVNIAIDEVYNYWKSQLQKSGT